MNENSVLTCRKGQTGGCIWQFWELWWIDGWWCWVASWSSSLTGWLWSSQCSNLRLIMVLRKDSFLMVYNTKWLFDCYNLVHSQHTQWYLAWQYPQWHLFGHEDISLKQLLWHLKVDKRIFYLLKKIFFVISVWRILNKGLWIWKLSRFLMWSTVWVYYTGLFHFHISLKIHNCQLTP